jgi:hypothetical protein
MCSFRSCIWKLYFIRWVIFSTQDKIPFIPCTGLQLRLAKAVCRPQLPYSVSHTLGFVPLLLCKRKAWEWLRKGDFRIKAAQDPISHTDSSEVSPSLRTQAPRVANIGPLQRWPSSIGLTLSAKIWAFKHRFLGTLWVETRQGAPRYWRFDTAEPYIYIFTFCFSPCLELLHRTGFLRPSLARLKNAEHADVTENNVDTVAIHILVSTSMCRQSDEGYRVVDPMKVLMTGIRLSQMSSGIYISLWQTVKQEHKHSFLENTITFLDFCSPHEWLK